MIKIGNERLRLEILEPYTEYENVRFDHMGFIRQVYLDGNPILADYYEDKFVGAGLCNEFGIINAVGYAPGEYFPKIGVGVLKGDNEPAYNFMRDYQGTPFDYEMEEGCDAVTFKAQPKACNGYAFSYEKTIRVTESDIEIAYTLTNQGEKEIVTDEYAHNFIPVSKPYQIRTPVEDSVDTHLVAKDGSIAITPPYTPPTMNRYTPKTEDTFFWELENDQGIVISETAGFVPDGFAVWGSENLIAPEISCKICIKPGETQRWSRKYHIEAK